MYTVDQINKIVNGKIIFNNKKNIDNFSINSKEVTNNTLFIPIKGKNHNGNDFILDAIKNGSECALMSADYEQKENVIKYCENNTISLIEVEDSLKALHSIAHYHRKLNKDTKIIAITGSNGKTSTKDLLYDILKQDYNVLKTEGNLNNHIGLPLTLLKLNHQDICIIEMGMNHRGEIELLSELTNPDIGIIINIGSAHIGNLGSIEEILKAKMEITKGLKKNGLLFLNKADKMLNTIPLNNNYTIMRYGLDNKITLKKNILNLEGNKINVKKVGESVPDIILAYQISKYFNIEFKQFKKYLKNHKKPKMRMELIKVKNNIIINDSYNANYDSMKYGIENILKNYSLKKYQVLLYLGDMLELGEWSKYYHEQIGKLINNSNINILYLSGTDVKYIYDSIDNSDIIKKEIKIENINSITEEIIKDLKKHKHNVIYFKGSRKIGLDKICNELIIRLINRS